MEAIIEAARDDRYPAGWAFPAGVSWTSTVFFGADVRETSLGWVREQVAALAAMPPIDQDGDRPVGHFVLSDERGRVWVWEVDDGVLRQRDAPELRWATKP